MFLPIVVLIFIFPAFLEDSRFIPFAGVFIFPFVLFTSYAILKHKLFNIKVVATGLLVFAPEGDHDVLRFSRGLGVDLGGQ